MSRYRSIGWKRGNELVALDEITRNKAEVLVLVSAIEAFILMLVPNINIDYNTYDTLQILIRRFETVMIAEKTNSWTHADHLSYQPSFDTCLPVSSLKQLGQRYKLTDKLFPSSSSSPSFASSSSSFHNKGRANGNSKRRQGNKGGNNNNNNKGGNKGYTPSSSTSSTASTATSGSSASSHNAGSGRN